jgi:tetratricopeptide (TPR) repeat protein
VLEWLIVVVPTAFSALVFAVALGTPPSAIFIQDVTVSSDVEQAGYPSETLAHLLESRADAIVSEGLSFHDTGWVDVGSFGTTVDTFANLLQLVGPVRATQQFLGMVDYIAQVHVTSQNSEVAAKLLVNNANSLIITTWQQMTIPAGSIEALVDRVATELIGITEPVMMARVLYARASTTTAPEFNDTLQYIKAMLPLVHRQDLPRMYNLLGKIAQADNQLDAAAGYYQIALRHQPEFALARLNWGRVYHLVGQYSQAIDHYRSALAIEPDLPIAHLYLAEALLAQGRLQPALVALMDARKLAPDFARVYEVRAGLYQELGLPRLAALDRERADEARVRRPRQAFYEPV